MARGRVPGPRMSLRESRASRALTPVVCAPRCLSHVWPPRESRTSRALPPVVCAKPLELTPSCEPLQSKQGARRLDTSLFQFTQVLVDLGTCGGGTGRKEGQKWIHS